MKIMTLFIRIICFFLIVFATSDLLASPLDKVWQALEKQDIELARLELNKLISQPETQTDATITLILLNTLEEKGKNLNIMQDVLPKIENPSPYLFSLWFDNAVVYDYRKKDEDRLSFIKGFLNDNRLNGSIKAASNYVMGMHYLFANNISAAHKTWNKVQSIKDWQFVGPFDNTSGSGFDKNYGPLDHPEPEAKFVSKTNYNMHWFTPRNIQKDPWVSPIYHVPADEGVVYAQTFVNNPESEKEVTLAFGGYGSLKLWVNDQLLIEQEEERQTELDIYKRNFKLAKGENRILVQLGYTKKTSYPNFIVRILDSAEEPVKGLSWSGIYKNYNRGDIKAKDLITHFAEVFFEKKIKEEPENILNYLLLSKVYYRAQKNNEAIKILKKAQQIYPNNILVNYELVLNYSQLGDRTEILKQIEYIRTLDPDLLFLAVYDFEINYNKENYLEAEKNLEKIKQLLGETDETYLDYYIKTLTVKQDYQTAISVIDKAFQQYPDNTTFLSYKFQVLKNTNNSSNKATKLFEKYLEDNLSPQIIETLVEEYESKNDNLMTEKYLLKMHKIYPEDQDIINKLINFYYKTESYTKSLEFANIGLSNAPFDYSYWFSKGYIHKALNDKNNAIVDFEKSIQYNPNLFEARERLRELQGKIPLLSYFQKKNVYDTIQTFLNKKTDSDDNYEYIFKDKDFVVFSEGASIEYSGIAIKILNASGVKHWKESTVSFDSKKQRLVIEKAEVVKQNGQKVSAEQNGSDLVFPSLEAGDAIYIAYLLENYTQGKLCKEIWVNNLFNSYVPVNESKFRLLTPPDYKFTVKASNMENNPKKYDIDDFSCYEWSFSNPGKCKVEDYMPPIDEIGMNLHISTVESWRSIADWYRDLALPQAKEDYNLNHAYDAIFKNKKYTSDYDTAKAIYEYICNNIRYSSVSFRQSNFTPQKPMVTLSTQLGDCKDLSTLYHALAKKAGLTTHLVLVNTRDNGEESIKLPSVDFNHCIIRIDLKNGPIYQELTSSKVSFGSVPSDIVNAQALIIPNTNEDTLGKYLIHIPNLPVISDEVYRNTIVKVEDNDIKINSSVLARGNMAVDYRDTYFGLTKDELKETVKSTVSKNFQGKLVLDTFNIDNLENQSPDIVFKSNFIVENEIKLIGGLKAVKVPFFEKIFTVNAFTGEERIYPIRYWRYENTQYYENETVLEIPQNCKLSEIPTGIVLNNKFIDYKLVVEKISDNSIKFTRKVKIDNSTLSADHYVELLATIQKILKAEDIYVAYK